VALLLGGARTLPAQAAAPCLPLRTVDTPPAIDGSVEGGDVWGAPLVALDVGERGGPCTDPVQRLFAVRSGGRTYVAVDVPESAVGDPGDTLRLFFDTNHDRGTAPGASDRAVRLVGFPAGVSQAPSPTAEMYTGTGTGWGAPAVLLTARASRTPGGTGRLVIEIELPFDAPSMGFAAVYSSGDLQDCDGDFVNDRMRWPPALPDPAGAPPGLADPSRWGVLGCAALPPTPTPTRTPTPRPTPPDEPPLCVILDHDSCVRSSECRWFGSVTGGRCLPI
jgi:hypothetical protein